MNFTKNGNKKQRCKHYHLLTEHPKCFLLPPPKAIFLDLEVSPQISATYGKFHEATIQWVLRDQYVYCFSYMDIGAKRAKVVSLPDFPLYKRDRHNDREVVKELRRIISSVDYVVAHNIAFDMRMFRARAMAHKIKPVFPKTVCTLKLARKFGIFPANTLKQLAIFLKLKHKMETSKGLSERIFNEGKAKDWREMKKYNGIDSQVGTEIFKIFEAWSEKPLLKPIKR